MMPSDILLQQYGSVLKRFFGIKRIGLAAVQNYHQLKPSGIFRTKYITKGPRNWFGMWNVLSTKLLVSKMHTILNIWSVNLHLMFQFRYISPANILMHLAILQTQNYTWHECNIRGLFQKGSSTNSSSCSDITHIALLLRFTMETPGKRKRSAFSSLLN